METNMTRRSFLKKALGTSLACTGIGFGGQYYANNIEPNWIEVNKITIKHPLIPSSFSGVKIVQFSDTHIGFQLQLEDLKNIISTINSYSPELVFFTGDLMDEPNKYPHQQELVPILSKLKAPMGKYAVYGNHDHGGYGSEIYQEMIEQSGFTLLRNANSSVSLLNKEEIFIAGIDEPMLGTPDFQTTFQGIPENVYTILLSHAPDLADTADTFPVHFQMSGHSHGGQVQIPLMGALVTPPFAEKYTEGTYQLNKVTLHVNRGLGTTRLPYRFLSRPEITLYELQSNAK
jgi:uncharacterized protein